MAAQMGEKHDYMKNLEKQGFNSQEIAMWEDKSNQTLAALHQDYIYNIQTGKDSLSTRIMFDMGAFRNSAGLNCFTFLKNRRKMKVPLPIMTSGGIIQLDEEATMQVYDGVKSQELTWILNPNQDTSLCSTGEMADKQDWKFFQEPMRLRVWTDANDFSADKRGTLYYWPQKFLDGMYAPQMNCIETLPPADITVVQAISSITHVIRAAELLEQPISYEDIIESVNYLLNLNIEEHIFDTGQCDKEIMQTVIKTETD